MEPFAPGHTAEVDAALAAVIPLDLSVDELRALQKDVAEHQLAITRALERLQVRD